MQRCPARLPRRGPTREYGRNAGGAGGLASREPAGVEEWGVYSVSSVGSGRRRLVVVALQLQASSALLAMAFAVYELLSWIPLTKLPLACSMIRELLGAQRGCGTGAGRDADLWDRV